MFNLTFNNNANTIAALESNVEAAKYFASTASCDSMYVGFTKEAAHFQTELDVEIAKRVDIMKSVTRADVETYVKEKQEMAKKYKSHADLINKHLEFYQEWMTK